MDEKYIIENIYPLIKRKQQQDSRRYWVELSVDPYNKHLQDEAKEKIAYIDSHPEEYPYPWMPKESP